jgi:cytoskeletal protein CcmA (bactofilin family)
METTMFNVQPKHPATPTNLVFNNIIGAGSSIQGDQIIKGHLLISGECIGNLKFDLATEDTAVVDLNGVMRGDITCKNAIVIGRVEGNLRVENRLEIYPSAIVNGDIDYGQIFIHADARVNGQLHCLLDDAESLQATPKSESVAKLKAV